MASRKLSDKQDKFVRHYLANGGNATEAAIAAGYSGSHASIKNQGYENLQKPGIIAAIEAGQAELKEKLSYDAQDKRELLYEIAQYNATKTIAFSKGAEVEMMRDAKAAISAIAELNKMDGDHSPTKTQQVGDIKIVLDADDMEL